MSRPSVKWAARVTSTLVALFCFSLLFVSARYQAWLGISVTHAGQASSPDLVVSSLSNPPASVVAGAVSFNSFECYDPFGPELILQVATVAPIEPIRCQWRGQAAATHNHRVMTSITKLYWT
jgi:hypothetical protein